MQKAQLLPRFFRVLLCKAYQELTETDPKVISYGVAKYTADEAGDDDLVVLELVGHGDYKRRAEHAGGGGYEHRIAVDAKELCKDNMYDDCAELHYKQHCKNNHRAGQGFEIKAQPHGDGEHKNKILSRTIGAVRIAHPLDEGQRDAEGRDDQHYNGSVLAHFVKTRFALL